MVYYGVEGAFHAIVYHSSHSISRLEVTRIAELGCQDSDHDLEMTRIAELGSQDSDLEMTRISGLGS